MKQSTNSNQGAELTLQQYESLVPDSYTGDKKVYLKLVKEKLVGQNLGTAHLQLFLYTANRTGLDPLANQIYAVARKDWKTGVYNMTIQTGIDGFRVIAQRSGDYAGQDDAVFAREQIFNPVMQQSETDLKASVTVWKIINGIRCPVTASARWSQYVQTDKDGQPINLWKKMPHLMLAKVAEALALRKAFPNDLSGVYTSEEMAQADNSPVVQPAMPSQVDPVKDDVVEGEVEGSTNEPGESEDKKLDRWNTKIRYLYKLIHQVKGEKTLDEIKQEILTKYKVSYMNELKEIELDEIIEVFKAEAELRVVS